MSNNRNDRPLVISLFDYTGKMVQPWIEKGYEAIIVDIQHPDGWTHDGPLHKLGFDLSRPHKDLFHELLFAGYDLRDVALVFSFTPCTDMAVSGARWFASKLAKNPRMWDEALHFAMQGPELARRLGCPYMVENPVSKLSTLWRKPDYSFQPHEFTLFEPADNYTKKTCLWTSPDFVMPMTAKDPRLGEPDDRIHKCPPSEERMNIRSATPMGFARAVCEANTTNQLPLFAAA